MTIIVELSTTIIYFRLSIFVLYDNVSSRNTRKRIEKSVCLFKKIGGNIVDDGGFTIAELESIKRGLQEALSIKKGEPSPLSMSDLWDD